jgi:hypothetical protein
MTSYDDSKLAWGKTQLDKAGRLYADLTDVDFEMTKELAYDCECCGTEYDHKVEVTIWYHRPPEGRERNPQRTWYTVTYTDLNTLIKEIVECPTTSTTS